MKRNALHPGRGSRKGRYAFTMVELLVVVGIITVLVAVVVGVSVLVISRASVERTKINMQVIHLAIEAYRDVEGDYPSDEADSTKPDAWPWNYETERSWDAYCRAKKLYSDLSSVPQARAHIANLDKDATKNVDGNNVFVDGFEKYIEYFKDKGAGGMPVVISAGADGNFETEKDNIRSDNQ